MNPCWVFPCGHGGTCTPNGMNYTCSCIKSVYGSNCQYYRDPTTNSTILNVNSLQNLKNLLNLPSNSTWKMLYQASTDGFASFHSKCDGVQGTLTVIKSNSSYIFGGYTQADWYGGYGIYKYDANAFLFSLVNGYNTPVKMIVTNPSQAIYASSYNGPTFGSGFDLYTSHDGSYGYSSLGNSYQLPSFLSLYGSAQSFLAGSYNFQPSEIEVYSVYINRKFLFISFL